MYLSRDVSKPAISCLLVVGGFDACAQPPVLTLNKNAVTLKRHGVRKLKDNSLASDNRRVNREPLVIESTHTNAQEDVLRSFVSHSERIISFLAQITNNLIKYHSHADRKKPSASPSGVFVCNNYMSLRAAEFFRPKQSPGNKEIASSPRSRYGLEEIRPTRPAAPRNDT